ncbi:hypothetical protein QYF61_004070 [Mycteria americana]|uniref:Diphosphoinositol polyphosphate phosphohydrolase 1 n=1 Tax=Mycteria americana TaxID=33587 RepID=A0AAN7RJC5_MYCAM|nr:hypothetical protein QYF61_004070 [Mycteria americana]
MMKLKSNQTRTYDGDGYKKRAACLCFRSESEEELGSEKERCLEFIHQLCSALRRCCWLAVVVILIDGLSLGVAWSPKRSPTWPLCEKSVKRTSLKYLAGVKGTLGRLVGIFENRDRKHRTYVYVLIVTEVLEDWEDSVNIGRKREWFKIEDAIKVLQYHKPVQASYFETLRQGCLANNGTPVMTTTYSESSMSDIR